MIETSYEGFVNFVADPESCIYMLLLFFGFYLAWNLCYAIFSLIFIFIDWLSHRIRFKLVHRSLKRHVLGFEDILPKNCPFCGGDCDVEFENKSLFKRDYQTGRIFCPSCGIGTEMKSPLEAINTWNSREG